MTSQPTLPLSSIIVAPGRQRREITPASLASLAGSIARRGLLHPIVITREGNLIAGERRLRAMQSLGWTDTPVRYLDGLSPIERQIIELEENIKREDLPWQDTCRTIGTLHGLFVQLDPGWKISQTAEECCLTQPWTSVNLRVAECLAEERIAKASSVREAYNALVRRDNRASALELGALLGEAQEEIFGEASPGSGEAETVAANSAVVLEGGKVIGVDMGGASAGVASPVPLARPASPRIPRPESACLLHESFLHWAPKYSGEKFNLIHCDFPYGINVFSAKQGNVDGPAYDDAEGVYFGLLEILCRNLSRLMSVSGHLVFWFSEKHRTRTLETFAALAPTIKFHPYPLIWVKSDNKGIAGDARRSPRHVYETALLGSQGSRQLVRTAADAYSCPTDRALHPSAKPEPMLRHFFEMLVDETTSLLDPTCGSGSALRAAESLGARRVLGMDTDEQTVGLARTALRQSRNKAGAAVRGIGL